MLIPSTHIVKIINAIIWIGRVDIHYRICPVITLQAGLPGQIFDNNSFKAIMNRFETFTESFQGAYQTIFMPTI